jgi:thioredoxin reductase (NADPH)
MHDIIIIGGGPAGLTAAIYALRANKSVLVLEKGNFGGQITYSPKVENIPGFVSVTGNEFAEKLVEQALELGAEIETAEVFSIKDGEVKTVITEDGDFETKTVIIATGAKHRLLGIENEENLIGNGISFCAVCDGAFYKNEKVAVIGGGNSALQEAILLSDVASKVYVVQNLDFLTGEKKLADQLYAKENVEIITGSVVKAVNGEDELESIVITKTADNLDREIAVKGMFIAIGLVPQNASFDNVVRLDAYGYADSDESCITVSKGVFVAGDCRKKKIRQVTTACADGAIAALAACEYIDNIK